MNIIELSKSEIAIVSGRRSIKEDVLYYHEEHPIMFPIFSGITGLVIGIFLSSAASESKNSCGNCCGNSILYGTIGLAVGTIFELGLTVAIDK